MDEQNNIPISGRAAEGIDFNKLRIIFRNNWIWMLLIFLATNTLAYLVIRYTQDLYESASELKLDIKQDATEFGFSEFVPERSKINVISGEIETIQSKSFLNQIIDSLDLHVSYYSIGKFLNTELYKSTPFEVAFHLTNGLYLNTPITIIPISLNQYQLKIGKTGKEITGTFRDTLELDGLSLFITRKPPEDFNLENTYSFVLNSREMLLDYLSSNLTVEPLKLEANTIRISFKDSNPFKARDIVNGIDSVYLQFSHEQKNRANRQKIEWLSSELKNIESQMEAYENYFEDFTLKNKTTNLESDLRNTIQRIIQIDSQRYEISRRIAEADQVVKALAEKQYLVNVGQRNLFPETLNKNIEKLQELYLEWDRMRLSYNETTFAYKQKENELETIRHTLNNQFKDLKTGWLKKMVELNQAKARLENEFAGMPDKNTQFSKNQRFYKLYEEFYLSLLQSRSEFEIAQAGSTPDFKILSTAFLPSTPISPNKPMISGVGFVAGMVLNIFFIGILYLLNNRINSLHEVERLSNVPLLGVVPSLYKAGENGLYITSHPKSMVSEAIRTLRTNLDFFKSSSQQKVIAISSTVSGEGKSFIAMNLGGVMALSNKRVILLDLDMRKAKNNSFFTGANNGKGMSTILVKKNNWKECVVHSSLENFDFLPSGPHPPNPAELLLDVEFTDVLKDLKNHYDFILMDTPPVGVVTDGIMAMKQADISIYIFRANYSKKDFVNNLYRIVRINKFNNITTVLNALPSTREDAYGYGYYEEEKKSWFRSIFSS